MAPMTETDTSARLIAAYYASHLEQIRAFVARHTDGSAESDDIVQNIFVRLLQSGKMISPITLPCLVYSVARNMIVDHWRRRRFVERYESTVRLNATTTDGEEPSTIYSVTEIAELLERGMARLSAKSRRIYAMNVVGGMRVSEISIALNENYKSVENRLGAARKEMRTYMRRMLA